MDKRGTRLSSCLAAAAALCLLGTAASARDWVVRPEWVRAHESFLASDALQGRGSATRDEAIAAAYVASQFEGFGLAKAPGMTSFDQSVRLIRPRLDGHAQLNAGGTPLASLSLLRTSGEVRGTLGVLASVDAAQMPSQPVIVVTDRKVSMDAVYEAAAARKVKLLIVHETDAPRKSYAARGNAPRLATYFEGGTLPESMAVATLSDADIDRLATRAGAAVTLTLPPIIRELAFTTNAIGYLPGTDPKAGVLLITAHLDHLGIVNGVVMPGANDDASGTTAVLELAHALAGGQRLRRGILFVCYGSEEIGGFGSRYFGAHPPVPLSDIVANLEIEMIGAQDPKLPPGTMMMTGYERSDFGPALRKHGALITSDPYPDQHFFERSDNYSLALEGVVAHTVSGWAVTPTYHQPTDTLGNLDIAFMTRAIQSLIVPLRRLASGDFKPAWAPGGRPAPEPTR
ncbi:M28 family peptidase [Sphingosinicellaceae bacterium]|nr:M28 family peptidase [Sphingosinicellaceae bacterium]